VSVNRLAYKLPEELQAALAALNDFSVAYQDGSDAVVKVQRRAGSA